MWILFAAACVPLAMDWPDRLDMPEHIRTASTLSDAPDDPDEVRVLTWNIKFGGGRVDFWFDGWGDRVHMTEAEVAANMTGLVTLINDYDPDLVMTQEVDLASARSAYVDQVDWILENTEMNYAAWVPVWESAYVAEEGLGPVKMGQAVFSRWPITVNTRIDLGPIGDQDALTRKFYLDRAIQRVEVDLGGDGPLTVLNNHPDAYSTDGTKARQIDQIFAEASSVDGELIVGGDFNAVPPGTINLTEYDDNNSSIDGERGVEVVTYEEEGDQLVAPFYASWSPGVPIDAYQAATTVEEQAPWFTHSVSGDVFWNRPLDYLWSDMSWRDGVTIQSPTATTAMDPMTLSDHCPLFAVLVRR